MCDWEEKPEILAGDTTWLCHCRKSISDSPKLFRASTQQGSTSKIDYGIPYYYKYLTGNHILIAKRVLKL